MVEKRRRRWQWRRRWWPFCRSWLFYINLRKRMDKFFRKTSFEKFCFKFDDRVCVVGTVDSKDRTKSEQSISKVQTLTGEEVNIDDIWRNSFTLYHIFLSYFSQSYFFKLIFYTLHMVLYFWFFCRFLSFSSQQRFFLYFLNSLIHLIYLFHSSYKLMFWCLKSSSKFYLT